jgi:hypothetical protein
VTITAQLESHRFVYTNEPLAQGSLPTLSSSSNQIRQVSLLIDATLEGGSFSSLRADPVFEERILSEVKVLSEFARSVTNPAVFLKERLHIENPRFFDCRITPIAVVLTIDGMTYGQFADVWHLRRQDTISLGSTLMLDTLPQELRGRVVVVNEGDGYFGSRSPDQIKSTERHELLHVLFNEFFSSTQFMTTLELARRLNSKNGIDDKEAYRELAQDLADSMFERARSEIISYCACGDFDIEPFEVDAQYWKDHIDAVVKYLDAQGFDDQRSDEILKVFVDSYEAYWRDTNRYLNVASTLPRMSYGLSSEAIAYLLLLNRRELINDPAVGQYVST